MARTTLLVLVFLLIGCDRRTVIEPDWSPEHLLDELARRGEVWESWPTQQASVVCKRPADAFPWEQLAELSLEHHARWGQQRGRLSIAVDLTAVERSGLPEPCILRIGRLVVRGHPDELARIRELFR